jgi:hypothetical protein
MKLSSCYYGDRKVIYVEVAHPDRKNGQKLVSVYGHSLEQVIKAVDKGLTKAFGKVGANRPKGRPKGKSKRRRA